MTSITAAHRPQGIWTTIKQGAQFTWRHGGLLCQAITAIFFEVLGLVVPRLAAQLHIAWLHLTTVWVRVKGAFQRHKLEEKIQLLEQEKDQQKAAFVQQIDTLAIQLNVARSTIEDEQRAGEGWKEVSEKARSRRDGAIERQGQAELERDLAQKERDECVEQIRELEAQCTATSAEKEKVEERLKTALAEVYDLQRQRQEMRGNQEKAGRLETLIAQWNDIQRAMSAPDYKEGDLMEQSVCEYLATIQSVSQENCEKIQKDMERLKNDDPTRILVSELLSNLKDGADQLTSWQKVVLLLQQPQRLGVKHVA